MKAKLKALGLLASLLLLVLAAYGYGYFRGYHDRSRVLTSVHLAINEGLYDNLQRNNPDGLRNNLKVLIYCESDELRNLEADPLGSFARDLSHDSAGDVPKQISTADEITKGMTFAPLPNTETK